MTNAKLKAVDKKGNVIEVSRNDWKKLVLLPKLKECWDDPDKLYSIIVIAVENGFSKDLIKSATHLMEIDDNKERSYALKSIIYMKCGLLEKARKVIEEFIDSYGTTGIILTNLAKIFYEEGEVDMAESTLWAALNKDPNQENAVLLWAALLDAKEEDDDDGGEYESEGYKKALEQIADIKGSWRAQMILAKEALDQDEVEDAINLYKEAITRGFADPEILFNVSRDLLQKGLYDEMFDIIVPIYNPRKHTQFTGFNLLQAYLDTNNSEQGMKLLGQLKSIYGPEIEKYSEYFSEQFSEMTN